MSGNESNRSREELEARLTALLLGETDPAETSYLQQLLEEDPGLATLYSRLQKTSALLQEAVTVPITDASADHPASQLSPQRRQALAEFWMNPARKTEIPSHRKLLIPKWSYPLAAAACLLGLLFVANFLVPLREMQAKRAIGNVALLSKPVIAGSPHTPPQDQKAAASGESQPPAVKLPSLAAKPSAAERFKEAKGLEQNAFSARSPYAGMSREMMSRYGLAPGKAPAGGPATEPATPQAPASSQPNSFALNRPQTESSSLLLRQRRIRSRGFAANEREAGLPTNLGKTAGANGRQSVGGGFGGGGYGGGGGFAGAGARPEKGASPEDAGRKQSESVATARMNSPPPPGPAVQTAPGAARARPQGAVRLGAPAHSIPSGRSARFAFTGNAKGVESLEERQRQISVNGRWSRDEQTKAPAITSQPDLSKPTAQTDKQLSTRAPVAATAKPTPLPPRDYLVGGMLVPAPESNRSVAQDNKSKTATVSVNRGRVALRERLAPQPPTVGRMLDESRSVASNQLKLGDRLITNSSRPNKPAQTPLSVNLWGRRTGVRGQVVQELAKSAPARRVEDAATRPGAAKPSNVAGIGPGESVDRASAQSEAPKPLPEVAAKSHPFSTFSLNVSSVSFRLAAASLRRGVLPAPAAIRSEEFINAFNYHDPDPAPGNPITLTWERARDPFEHNRDLLRFSLRTAARGRQPSRPLNLVLLLDDSGSMERPDRVAIVRTALTILARQLTPQDRISVVAFARTARLWIDGLPGGQPEELLRRILRLTPEGGTNLEDALALAYQIAAKHFLPQGNNRVLLLTDGAANLGNVDPAALQVKVETNRQKGIALDCFGVGWQGYNDNLLEVLSNHGDGRYAFLNSPEEAKRDFANQLAGAFQVAAADVKVQVEFNPNRTITYRQIGYAHHQLTKEQFRDNRVDAAELGAAESGTALYTAQINPHGTGRIATVRVRFRVPSTGEYEERAWPIPYEGEPPALEAAPPSLRLAAVAGFFGEWLARNPYAAEITPDRLLALLNGVPERYSLDPAPKQLEWMIRKAGSLAGQ